MGGERFVLRDDDDVKQKGKRFCPSTYPVKEHTWMGYYLVDTRNKLQEDMEEQGQREESQTNKQKGYFLCLLFQHHVGRFTQNIDIRVACEISGQPHLRQVFKTLLVYREGQGHRERVSLATKT